MKTPLNWISLYTPLSSILSTHSTTELAHEYSIHTAEIDGIESHFLDRVVVGKVVSCSRHPDSKKLSIVEVQISKDENTIILTGAPNISEATYVPVALVGAVLGGDFQIGERMMAGMMSRGMICGADEIGLATESDGGIMVLESIWDVDLLESMIGKSLFDLTLPFPGIGGQKYEFALRDTTFEIDNKFITNRPDLFGVYGNAREWGAVFGLDFQPYTASIEVGNIPEFSLRIETDRCLAYHAIEMRDISVGQSPWGIRLMMERAGLSAKMDLVDITNLILTEFGQPMHVFDADKVVGGITVRLAKVGEKLLALNGIEYELTTEDMVIADETGPIALAGVIGGMESAVSLDTRNVIWESATFDAISVRLSAQRHGVRTDASTRYEKSLDPLLSGFATARIFDYLTFLGKHVAVSRTADYLDEKQVKHIEIEIGYDFIDARAGAQIPRERVRGILISLGFKLITDHGSLITLHVPSWRASKDISIREDIVEEVIRIYGYDQITPLHIPSDTSISLRNPTKVLRDGSLDFWKSVHYSEVYNYSFTNQTLETAIGYTDMTDAVGIQNAFNVEYTHMRRSLSVRLFDNIAKNKNIRESLRFFEIGKIYSKDQVYTDTISGFLSDIPVKPYGEQIMIAGVTTTDTIESLRSHIESYLTEMIGYVPPLHQSSLLPFLHPGVSGEYRSGDQVFVRFGRVHPATAEALDIPSETLYWEGDFATILRVSREREVRVAPISRFQSIAREINFVMDESVQTGMIAGEIDATHPWISGVVVDSIYRDEIRVGAGKKSINFAFFLTSHEHTISDEQALSVQNEIIDKMRGFGCILRG